MILQLRVPAFFFVPKTQVGPFRTITRWDPQGRHRKRVGWKSIAGGENFCSKDCVFFSPSVTWGVTSKNFPKKYGELEDFLPKKNRNLKKSYVSELVYDGKIMIDWSFRTLTLGAGFKYFYFRPHLGKMNHFDEHIFQIFSKPPTERKQFEEASAEIGLSQEVQKVAWEWGCSDRHIGARCENLWFMTCWAFLKLRSRTANLVMICTWMCIDEYIYTVYIYIIFSQKHIDSHLVCFPKRFIYTVRLHLKTSSLFASLFGGGRPLTSQALKMNGVEQSRWSHELMSSKWMIDPRNYIHSLKLTVTYPLKNDGLGCFCVISF